MPCELTFTISRSCGVLSMLFESPDRQNLLLYCCGVICVYELGKEIEQACQPATFVSEAMLGVTYQVVHL